MLKSFTNSLFKLILLVFVVSSSLLYSKPDNDEEINEVKSKMPSMLGSLNNQGQDFWFSAPPAYTSESSGSGNFIKVFAISPIDTKVSVEILGKGYYLEKSLKANVVEAWDLTPDLAMPFNYKAENTGNALSLIYEKSGIHVSSKTPIIVYVMVRYAYTSDGWCAIPNSGQGKDYVVASYTDYDLGALRLPGFSNITAIYDNTVINIKPGASVMNNTIILLQSGKAIIPEDNYDITLQKGDVFCMLHRGSKTQTDITGTRIKSDKPISVVSGHHCTDIPVGNHWCDYTVEAQLPTSTWGTCIHVPKINNRAYPGVIRIFAKEDSTTIYRDGNQVAFLSTDKTIEGYSWVEMRVVPIGWNTGPKQAVFTSDKPFSINYYNPGIQEDQNAGKSVNSDPFNMVMTPIEQYHNDISFCTPAVLGGANFPQNYLNLVYELDSAGNIPEDLEYGECIGSTINWYSIRDKFPGVDDKFEVDYKGRSFANKNITLPGDGVYKIRCNSAKFACYSYGFGPYDSYAYPTATALSEIFTTDFEPPVPTYTQEKDGSVNDGVIDDQVVESKSKVHTNLALIALEPLTSFNYELNTSPFVVGNDSKTNWNLKVVDPSKNATAVIRTFDKAGNDTTIVINYQAIINDVENGNYDNYALAEIFPNPVNSLSKISFDIPKAAQTTVSLINSNGEIISLLDKNLDAGTHSIEIPYSKLNSGVYYYQLVSGNYKSTKKFVVQK